MTDLATDVLAIQNLKARYCAGADLAATNADAARQVLRSVFTADFRGDYGFGPLEGPDAIIEFLCTQIAASSEWLIHMLHSPQIVIDGAGATGDWTVMAMMKRREGGARDTVLGRYSDVLRRTDDGWRIARLTFSRLE